MVSKAGKTYPAVTVSCQSLPQCTNFNPWWFEPAGSHICFCDRGHEVRCMARAGFLGTALPFQPTLYILVKAELNRKGTV